MKGSSNCTVILPMASRVSPLPASAPSNSITSSGATKIPSRLEEAALHTAAATLPRASAVKAIADCTVRGRARGNSMPRYSSCPISGEGIGLSSRPRTGSRPGAAKRDARLQLGPPQRRENRLEQQALDRKQDEGAGKHQLMQSPVARAGPDRLPGQAGTVHEQQQTDGQFGDPAVDHRRL